MKRRIRDILVEEHGEELVDYVGFDPATKGGDYNTRTYMTAVGDEIWVTGIDHWSDCAQHNEPAIPNGPCDSKASQVS